MLPLSQIRVPFLRFLGAKIGVDTLIDKNVSFYHCHVNGLQNLYVGDNVRIYRGALIDVIQPVHIASNVTFSPNVKIFTHSDPCQSPLKKYYKRLEAEVRLEDGCWICTGTIILPGVTIGKNSIVAAGSVVNNDVSPYTLVAGVPAETKKRLAVDFEET